MQVAVTASLTNHDSAACSPRPFSLSAVLPASTWGVTYGASGGALGPVAPGASATLTISITPPLGTSGSFGFSVRAADGSGVVQTSVNGSVVLAPVITVIGSASRNNRWTTLSARAMTGSLPVSGASVTFTVRSPTGATSSYGAVTAADGTASVAFRSSSRDAKGTWQVMIRATRNGGSGTATTSYVVP